MAKSLLFQFWVKPSGVFASKRYANVFVDDNGNITREDVPGQPSINLPNIGDYKSSSFPYGQDQQVTQFCNTTTFTRYTVKAQRSAPWAYTVADLNVPACGYQEPLPTPAVPANPFGNLTYGLYAKFNYSTKSNISKQVNIYKRNFLDEEITIRNGGSTPIEYSYTKGDYKFEQIVSRECEFSFIAEENFQLDNIYTADEREYRLDVVDLDRGVLDFSGFIIPDNSDEPFSAPPYEVTIRATDGLGALKSITYPMPIGSSSDIKQSFLFILAFALAKTNLNLDIMTMVNLYAVGMLNGISDDPIAQGVINPLRMTNDKGQIYTCYDAIVAVCTQFGASIAQVNGQWRIGRINELAKGTGRYRLYDYTARFKFAGTLDTLRLIGNFRQSVIIQQGATMSTQPPYKYVKVDQVFGRTPTEIFNGNFEQWDGQNFTYWTRYGNISVSQVLKYIVASAGVLVPTEDHACQFNQKANSGKWLQALPIWINKGQTSKLLLNIGKTDGLYDFKVRFNIGQFFLTNANGSFEWVSQLATTTMPIDNTNGDIFSFSLSIEIPEAPVSGELNILVFGFVKMIAVSSGTPPPGSGRPTRGSENGVGGTTVTYYESDQYTPIAIDNLSMQITVKDDERLKGLTNVSQQNGFYSNKKDDIEVIWGEFLTGGFDPLAITGSFVPAQSPRIARPTTGDGTSGEVQDQLQTIYLPNGDPAYGWVEYGESNTPLPIGLSLARSILKAYQTPYKQLSQAKIKGENLTYYDTFNIKVPNNSSFTEKIFIWQDVVFNDKEEEASGNLVEVFARPILSNDYTAPSTGGELPPIVQNPNPPIKINGIFTEQFTPEFT